MKKKNGFIAVSLIYSFFLVFLMVMLASTVKNASTRVMLNTIKNDIKDTLNGNSEFIITTIPKKGYSVGTEIDFVGEKWLVVENKPNSVVLVLKRALNMKEVTSALEVNQSNTDYFANSCNASSCKVRMCFMKYMDNACYYQSGSNYVYYNWQNSVAKKVVEAWLSSNINLQKVCRMQYDANQKKYVCSKDGLINMTFSDGIQNNTGYIRIATNSEASVGRSKWVNINGGYAANEAWSLTKQNLTGGKSILYDIQGSTKQNDHVMTIRPVIEAKKS